MQLRFHVNGKFRIEGPGGADLTPSGSKECGLIALLLDGQAGMRARGWLQAHLWSDRGPEQAASSLRQAVYRVKKSLGDAEDIIFSTRQSVGLDISRIEIVARPNLEYFEGLDVRDSEFELWLTQERASRATPPDLPAPEPCAPEAKVAPPRRVFLASAHGEGSGPLEVPRLEKLFSDGIARSITEAANVRVFQCPADGTAAEAWQFDIEVSALKSQQFLARISLKSADTGQSLWSENTIIQDWDGGALENEQIIELIQAATVAFNERFIECCNGSDLLERADALCAMGIKKLFTARAADIAEADRLFADAYARHPRGLYLAWRAQVRQFELVERVREDRGALHREAEAFVRYAFEAEPLNSMVLALVASFNLHFSGDAQTSLDYAVRAVKRNFGNAVAWWVLSSAHLVSGNPAKAYGSARMAVRMSEGTPFEFWTLSQLAGAAIAVRDIDSAKRTFKTVAFGRPHFRPPLRYLLAIHATHEEWDDAMAAVKRLQALEPGFSIDRLANDRDYPVSLLHKSVGLDRDKVLSLI